MLRLGPVLFGVELSEGVQISAAPVLLGGNIAGNEQPWGAGRDLRVGGGQSGNAILETGQRAAGASLQAQNVANCAGGSSACQVGCCRVDDALQENRGAIFHAIVIGRARPRSGSESRHAWKIGGAVERGDGGLCELDWREGVGVPEGGIGTTAGCSLNLVGSSVQAVLLNSPV